MRTKLCRLRRDSSGQALVEFAIVSPLIVLIILFSVWFYELVHIKLKVQEAARYAAWEATAYPLHDYEQGPDQLGQLSSDMIQAVQSDTMERYADLDSATQNTDLMTRMFAAQFTRPVVIMTDRQEEAVPGGPIVNMIFSIAGTLFDFFSALSYRNVNPVAMDMIAAGRDMGGARTVRMFGSSEWGFNRNGYVCSSVMTFVQNTWFNRGVGRFIMPNWGVLIKGQPKLGGNLYDHCVLADSWRLNNGDSVGGSDNVRPGVAEGTGYWEQVNRMYFVKRSARGRADYWIRTYKDLTTMMLQVAGVTATPPFMGDRDWVQATVVSRAYSGTDAERAGKVTIQQDRGSPNTYDTAPVGLTGNAGQELRKYGETLQDRGEYFMGCDRMMSLGCPTATLQQDNPFGDYVYRGGGAGSGSSGGTP